MYFYQWHKPQFATIIIAWIVGVKRFLKTSKITCKPSKSKFNKPQLLSKGSSYDSNLMLGCSYHPGEVIK